MTTKLSIPIRASRTRFARAAAALGILGAAGVPITYLAGEPKSTLAALCLLQASALALMLVHGLGARRGWVTGSFVIGAAWAALFLVPSVVYTVTPSLFGLDGLVETIAIVTAGTCAFVATFLLRMPAPAAHAPVLVEVPRADVRWRLACAGYALGLLALSVIVTNAGGPIEYLRSLSRTAGLNGGLFYVVAVVLLIRWVPVAIIAQRWGEGRKPGWPAITAFVIGTILLGLTGARIFLVIAALELAMLWALLRKPIPTGRLVAGGLVLGLIIIFGFGTVKRYQGAVANGSIGDQGFVDYATKTAPSEFGAAYVNNYVDTVRLIAMARLVVPDQAPYETWRPVKEMLLKPIPSRVRPELDRSPTIGFVFAPPGDTAYAVPLQATAMLSGGPLLLILLCGACGALVASIDRRVLAMESAELWKVVGVVAVIIQTPAAIRSGIPNGVASAATDVIGSTFVAWLVVRRPTLSAKGEPEATVLPAEPHAKATDA